MSKVGRNDPCPCGSGKKYKKCCIDKSLPELEAKKFKQYLDSFWSYEEANEMSTEEIIRIIKGTVLLITPTLYNRDKGGEKMPRTPRQKSKSGIYHIILRGANRQEIFHDEQDFLSFTETLERYKRECGIKVYGWCLMTNHIHILMEEGKEELAITMKRIGVSFAWYYNWKYHTTGHLFQDRYKSEDIESNEYLTTVIRYIHQNPLKAGVVNKPSDWKWSSCQGYYGYKVYPQGLLDRELILGLFCQDESTAIERLRNFCEAENEDKCMDDDKVKRLRDEEARVEIEGAISGFNIAQIKSLTKDQRDEIIKKLKFIEGVTQSQLARILGVSQALISISLSREPSQ